jgi:hypothetical protein
MVNIYTLLDVDWLGNVEFGSASDSDSKCGQFPTDMDCRGRIFVNEGKTVASKFSNEDES